MQNKINNIKEVSLRINLGTRPIFGHGKAGYKDVQVGMQYKKQFQTK